MKLGLVYWIIFFIGIFSGSPYFMALSLAFISLVSFLLIAERRNVRSLRWFGFFIFMGSTIDLTRQLFRIIRSSETIVFHPYIEILYIGSLIFSVCAFIWFLYQRKKAQNNKNPP